MESYTDKPSILIVDDDPITVRKLGRMLSPHAEVFFATNAEDALTLLRDAPVPDLILLDAELPSMSGMELCRAVKTEADFSGVPIIFVTGHSEPEFQASCFALGAADYVQKPVEEIVLVARIKTHIRLKQLTDQLRRAARVDALTELANRRALDETLSHEWNRAVRNNEPLSLLLLDIDHFKAFNDHYGHQAGDRCLRQFADLLRTCASRASDLPARYGGEEFALLLPDTGPDGARCVANRFLTALKDAAIPHAAAKPLFLVSASIGVSTFDPAILRRPADVTQLRNSLPPPAAQNHHPLIEAADRALYEAKDGGRRRASFQPVDPFYQSAVPGCA